jgi:ammonia channel protein AmtB
VVHIAAGLSGLAAILVLRKRLGYPEHAIHPNSMVLTLLGAGMLWFGWIGFNGGSALASNGLAGAALTASQVAAAAAALSWMLAEWLHRGKPTALGLASGVVAGLVAVTPASGFASPMGALVIGLLAGLVCYVAVCLKPFLKYDDSLDAFGAATPWAIRRASVRASTSWSRRS